MAPPSTATIAPRIAFVSLGCPKNLVDSEQMLGSLTAEGCRIVNSDDPADAIIINTCGFLEASKEESLAVIRDAVERKARGEVGRVVVAGCLVQRHRAKLLEWAPGIDAMIGVFDRDRVLEAVTGPEEEVRSQRSKVSAGHSALGTRHSALIPRYWIAANALAAAQARGLKTVGLTVNGADGKGLGYFEDDSRRFRLTPRHWAYLRVSEGCNQRCAFCTIPSIRGKMRSKPLDRIVAEARQLLAGGAFELNLIGQDTTSYGYDIYDAATPTHCNGWASGDDRSYSGDLIGLLTALNDAAREQRGAPGGAPGGGGGGGGWIRLMYVYPTHFTDEMIDAIARLEHVVKYIDIPLQHMSDRMLGAMRRNITRDQQVALLEKLRERIPGVAIRTTFITGFPGETPEDHQDLLDFVRGFSFDMMGVFKYSREDGTPGGTMDLDPALHVPDEIKAQREAELMLAQQEIAFENAAYLAQQQCQFDVLIDGSSPGDRSERGPARYVGRCYHQAPQVDSVTHVRGDAPLSPGELVRCTIVDSDGYDLIARPTAELERAVRLPLVGRSGACC